MRSESQGKRRRSGVMLLVVMLVLSAVAMGTAVAQDNSVNQTGDAQTSGGTVKVNPPHELVGSSDMTPGTLTPQSVDYRAQCVRQLGHPCYGPRQIRSAYGIPRSYTGAGQSIVIVVAYGSPTVGKDLGTFDRAFGLPNPTLKVYYPQGRPSRSDNSWALETSLDVQWAHAIAPRSAIKLVVARNNSFAAMNVAKSYAVDHNLGKVMSFSFGAPEAAYQTSAANRRALNQSHATLVKAAQKHISVLAPPGIKAPPSITPTGNRKHCILPRTPTSRLWEALTSFYPAQTPTKVSTYGTTPTPRLVLTDATTLAAPPAALRATYSQGPTTRKRWGRIYCPNDSCQTLATTPASTPAS